MIHHNTRTRLALPGIALVVAALGGCASTSVGNKTATEAAAAHTRPDRILVYDFAASPADLPPDSALAALYREQTKPRSAKEMALGRWLGELIANRLVEDLNAKKIPAVNGSTGAWPRLGDGVIRGEFVTISKGSATKRILIGFGSGAAELKVLVEAYQVTRDGLTPLGSAEFEAAGGKLPGILVPVGVAATAGSVATAAAVSGTSNVLQEVKSESLDAEAKRISAEIAAIVAKEWDKRGWR